MRVDSEPELGDMRVAGHTAGLPAATDRPGEIRQRQLARRGETLPTNQMVVFPQKKLSCRDTKATMTCNQDEGFGEFKLAFHASHARRAWGGLRTAEQVFGSQPTLWVLREIHDEEDPDAEQA